MLLKSSIIRRPELLFRPTQLFRRLLYAVCPPAGIHKVRLPWGPEIEIDALDRIGNSILKTGSYDTAVIEILARLTDPGETCLDIGANIGLMSSILAVATGKDGKVVSFEPHPELAKSLTAHLTEWKDGLGLENIELHQVAVSNTEADQRLCTDEEFSSNRGTAHIGNNDGAPGIAVRSILLDKFLPGNIEVGVLKIDIEGHEKAALEGAAGLLEKGAIRDIVFECHEGYPSEVSESLEAYGYEIFLIRKGLLRPLLLPPTTELEELPNFLATRSPDRAKRLTKRLGYRVLRGQVRPTS